MDNTPVFSYKWAFECGVSQHWQVLYIYHLNNPSWLMGWYYGKTLPYNANLFEKWMLVNNSYTKVENS